MRNAIFKLSTPDAVGVLTRFPLAVLAAAMLAGRALFWDGEGYAQWRSEPALAWRFGWTVALMASVAITIFAESIGGRRSAPLQAIAVALGSLAWLGYGTPYVSPLWTIVALGLLILVAAAPGRDEQALWSFNARAVALLIFAFVATSTVVLGLIAIKATTEYLFETKFGARWNERIFTIGYWFVFPVYWCALAPARDQPPLASDDLLSKAGVVFGALLALVTAALAVLLYLYAGKIAFDGSMPKNQVGWIVSVALSVGVFGWLLAAGQGGPAPRARAFFRRWWFPATSVPIVLLAFAIWERIAAYGVTFDRYAVGVAAIASLAFLVLTILKAGPPTIRGVLLAGAAVAVLAAVGPQSAGSIVARSQTERLKAILEAEGLLTAGRIAGPVEKGRLADDRTREIASILREIDAAGATPHLSALTNGGDVKTIEQARSLFGAAGRAAGVDVINFEGRPNSVVVESGRLVGPVDLSCGWGKEPQPVEQTIGDVRFILGPTELTATWPDGEAVFDVASLAIHAPTATEAQRPMSLVSLDGRSTLLIARANFRRSNGVVTACGLQGTALVRPR